MFFWGGIKPMLGLFIVAKWVTSCQPCPALDARTLVFPNMYVHTLVLSLLWEQKIGTKQARQSCSFARIQQIILTFSFQLKQEIVSTVNRAELLPPDTTFERKRLGKWKWEECVKHFGPLLWSMFLTVGVWIWLKFLQPRGQEGTFASEDCGLDPVTSAQSPLGCVPTWKWPFRICLDEELNMNLVQINCFETRQVAIRKKRKRGQELVLAAPLCQTLLALTRAGCAVFVFIFRSKPPSAPQVFPDLFPAKPHDKKDAFRTCQRCTCWRVNSLAGLQTNIGQQASNTHH